MSQTDSSGAPSLTERMTRALEGSGYTVEPTPDGQLGFTYEEQKLRIRCVEGEVDFIQLYGQWQMQAEIPQEVLEQLHASNDTVYRLPCVKTGVAGGTFVATSEHLIHPDEDPSTKLRVAIDLVRQAFGLWHASITSDDRSYLALATNAPAGE